MKLETLMTIWDTIMCSLWRNSFKKYLSSEVHDLSYHNYKLEEILTQNIIPFWYPRTLDRKNGGFAINHDVCGKYEGPKHKFFVAQARLVWFLSMLARTKYGNQEHLDAAQHGYEFMMNYCWDTEHGGFYWEVANSGRRATASEKHICAQAFGLYAISAYAQVSGDAHARNLAQEIFVLLDNHAHDSQYGGYYEFFRRDWSHAPETQIMYMWATPLHKTLNTHLHLLEAFTEYYHLTKDYEAGKRLSELIKILTNKVVNKRASVGVHLFNQDWSVAQHPHAERVIFGHDLERIWLVIEACHAINIPVESYVQNFNDSFNYTLRYGYDYRKGGLYDHGVWLYVALKRLFARVLLYNR